MSSFVPGRNICSLRTAGIIAILMLYSHPGAWAQSMDTALTSLQKKNAISVYYRSLQQQSGLYNGSEYVPYVDMLKESHPYFDTSKMVNGSVYYNGISYTNVPMVYDIVRDELIILHFNKVFFLQLIKSKTESFEILGHSFVHLGRDSTKKEGVRDSFYDLLYNGKIKLYAKREKMILESIPNMTIERKTYSKNRYFIFKKDRYTEVYSKKSLLYFFNDKKSILKQSLKKQKIKFRKQREQAIIAMVEQYDLINP
ncbi:MAG: hypothetical protein J0H29_11990 [Sphingobacteriales bacterium]|nr:hypothetical protein [Sphingobacteriales bacterium]OJY84258.1 MAG: hypothetical protein BGP14_18560 [Sphingobacteriales bacterium 44-15]